MKKILFCLLLFASTFITQAQTKSVTLDLLGPSGLVGVSFDSRFKGNDGFGVSVGLAFPYGTWYGPDPLGFSIPLELNYLLGQRNNHLVLGVGMTNGIYKSSVDGKGWGYNFYCDAGYRFQKQKGFTFGAGIKPNFVMNDWKSDGGLMPYLGLGFSF